MIRGDSTYAEQWLHELHETEPGIHTVLEIFHLVSWTLTEQASRAQAQGSGESDSPLCFTWKISPKQTQNDSEELKNDHKQTQNDYNEKQLQNYSERLQTDTKWTWLQRCRCIFCCSFFPSGGLAHVSNVRTYHTCSNTWSHTGLEPWAPGGKSRVPPCLDFSCYL